MKKILSILLLAFFIGGNFSWAQTCVTGPGAIGPCAAASLTLCEPCLAEKKADCNAGYNYRQGNGTIDQEMAAGRALDACLATPANNSTTTTPPTPQQIECMADPTKTRDTTTNTCVTQSTNTTDQTLQDCNPACTDGKQCNCTPTGCTCTTPTTTTTTPGLPEDQNIMGMTIGPKCLLNGQCKFNIYDALGIRTSVRNEGDPTSVGIFVQDIVLSATMFIGTIVTIAIIVSGLMRIFAGASGKDPTKAKAGLLNALIGLLIVVSSYLIIRLVQYIAKGF